MHMQYFMQNASPITPIFLFRSIWGYIIKAENLKLEARFGDCSKKVPFKRFLNPWIFRCFLRFDGILLMFLHMLRDLPCHLQLWLEKGSYFTPHTTFTQNALKHEKMHSSSRPFNSKNVVFQSVHKWHLPIWKMPLQHFFQAWKVLKNSSNISKHI